MSISEGQATMSDRTDYDRLQKDVDAVKNDISGLAHQIADMLNSVAGTARSQARQGYRQARSSVDSLASDVGNKGSAALESAQEAASTLGASLEDAVQQRPLASVGLALGLGLLIGASWRR